MKLKWPKIRVHFVIFIPLLYDCNTVVLKICVYDAVLSFEYNSVSFDSVYSLFGNRGYRALKISVFT